MYPWQPFQESIFACKNAFRVKEYTAATRFPNLEIAWPIAKDLPEHVWPEPRLHFQYIEKYPAMFNFLSQSGSRRA
jgi:hypothetical protein